MITVPAADIADFLLRRPAPAFGPGLSLGNDLATELATHLGASPAVSDWFQLLLRHHPDGAVVSDFVEARSEPALLASWGACSWPAVLSLTIDTRFDGRLRTHQDKNPARPPVLAIDDLTSRVPDRVLPVFRLLGTVGRPSAATSTPLYLQRRAKWRFALQAFSGVTRGAPLLLMGFEDAPSLLLDLMAEFQAVRSYQPQAFCFFASDPVLTAEPALVDTIEQLGKIVLLDVGPQEFANLVGKSGDGPPPSPSQPPPILDLKTLSEHVVLVSDHLQPTAAPGEINRMLDVLAAPATLDWNPFAYDLDLPRTATADVTADLRTILAAKDFKSQAFVISGPAVTGKTILAKRISFDLATNGRHVLWLRPVYASDAADVVKRILKAAAALTRRVVVVMDDPLAFPALSALDVAEAARAAQVSILLLTTCRASDRALSRDIAVTGGLPLVGEYALPTALDDSELALLPEYLAGKLRLAASSAEAKLLLPDRPTSDTLALLHLLLPQTRKHIEESLKDEYFRLGETATLAPMLSDAYQSSGMLLQHAYRLVAVATSYRAPLPLELLVGALGVSYADWLEAVPLNSAAWGLLYPDQADAAHSITYRTRNDLVAEGLRRIVNGGTVSRAGEVQALYELLIACSGTQSLYREFVVKVLVNSPTFDGLSFEDGLRLFDAATTSLPFRDRTLLHHKARWIRQKGPDIMQAFPVLDEALATPQNPYRKEMDEHIHTTYARTILDALRLRKITVEAAKRGVSDHLGRATSDEFVNVHATHVGAETTLELLAQLPKEPSEDVDRAALTAQAMDDLDRTMQLVKHGSDVAEVAGELQMLEVSRDKLIATIDYDPEVQWTKFRSQAGFVSVAQRMLAHARNRRKGTDYNAAWQSVLDAIAKIEADGATPSAQLHEMAAMTYYYWRIQRVVKMASEKIDWPMFRGHVERAIKGRDVRRSAMLQYMLALSLCHEGQWPEATALFQKLRTSSVQKSVVHLPRDFLLTEDGAKRRIQGAMKSGASALFFISAELGLDCLADRKGPWPMSESEQVHAHVRFTMAGPMAFRSL